MSRTIIEIDDKLLREGLKLTNLKTKRELINHALEELVKKIKRKRILKFEGRVAWQGDLDEIRGCQGNQR